MNTQARSRKGHTAIRLLEILEYFDEVTTPAKVMDIARRLDCPQSSVSDLLSVLVDRGILYKSADGRSYRPTPKAALLGSRFQPDFVRNGVLSKLIEDLREQTRVTVLVAGMVGVRAQVVLSAPGHGPGAAQIPISGQLPLSETAAGWLLLSTVPGARREAMLRRLQAEARAEAKFSLALLQQRVELCAATQTVVGPLGFLPDVTLSAMLAPTEAASPPLVVGLAHPVGLKRVRTDLLEQLRTTLEGSGFHRRAGARSASR